MQMILFIGLRANADDELAPYMLRMRIKIFKNFFRSTSDNRLVNFSELAKHHHRALF